MTAYEIERAIRLPAKQAQVSIDSSVVAQIVADASSQPGALPLMQFALTELFDQRIGRTITLENFESIGGTLGALAAQAEYVYSSLSEKQQEATRQIYLRLVTLGEGTEDVSRRALQRELMAVDNTGTDIEYVVQLLAANRLLTLDIDREEHMPTVEIAHEALIREWQRLKGWLDESRNDVRLERMLAVAALDWDQAQQEVSYLLQGARLEQFEAWSRTTDLALTHYERVFLNASVAEENKQQYRWRIIRYAAVSAISLIAVVVSILALWANSERISAETQKQRAEIAEENALMQASIGLASISERELEGTNPERSVLLALEALENYPYTSQAQKALARAVDEYRAFRALDASESITNQISVATFSPDGQRVAGGAIPAPKSVVIWDVASGTELLSVEKHSELCKGETYSITQVAWSPNGEQIATHARTIPGEDCGIVIWDTMSGETRFTLSEYKSRVTSLDWSPDGSTILTGHEDGSTILWDTRTGTFDSTLNDKTVTVEDIQWSPSGNYIAIGLIDGMIGLQDTESGEHPIVLRGHAGPVRSLAWSPDGSRLVSGGSDGLPRVWDTLTGETLLVMRGHTDVVDAVDWSSDGRHIASHSQDATVKIWDATTGDLMFEIGNATASYVEFSADGEQILASNQADLSRVYLWNAKESGLALRGHNGWQEYGAWSPDGTFIATSSGMDRTVRIWDSTSGNSVQVLEHSADNRSGDWSPDSTQFVVPTSADHSYIVWDVRTGKPSLEVSVPDGLVPFNVSWSPDSRAFAGVNFAPEGGSQPIYIWDAGTGTVLLTFEPDDNCFKHRPGWSPDSDKIVTGCVDFAEPNNNTPARIWDATNGQEHMVLESEHGWSIVTEWSPDGEQILVTYEQGVVRIWDADIGEPTVTYAGHLGGVMSAQWSPNGTHIASGDITGLVKVWDSETAQETLSFSIPGEATSLNWSPDGKYIIVTGFGLNVPVIQRIWKSSDELIQYAYDCCVSRELTPEEHIQFGLSPK